MREKAPQAQSERRVLAGEPVPAGEKLLSLFDPHADIIVKGSRDEKYDHKLNLSTGRSGMILDVVIETGNPRDSDRLLPVLERHIAFYGQAPRQAAADGGFVSRDNLATAKSLGVRDMTLHKTVISVSAERLAGSGFSEGEAVRVTHPTSAPPDLFRSAPRVG
jgi:IS5 family transposase